MEIIFGQTTISFFKIGQNVEGSKIVVYQENLENSNINIFRT